MESIDYIPKMETIDGFVGLLLLLLYAALIVTVFEIVWYPLSMGSNVTVYESDVFDKQDPDDIERTYCSTEIVSHKVYHV